MGRPRAAKAFRVGWEKTERCGWMERRAEKPLLEEKMARSSALSPMAIAGRGVLDDVVEMMPKGMLAREKCEVGEIGSQDFAAMIRAIHIDSVFHSIEVESHCVTALSMDYVNAGTYSAL